MPTHTSRAYQQELSELQQRLIAMGSRCEQLIDMASRAMGERDADLAAEVEEADRRIDVDEMEIDELTVRILALRQPAARDLRFLVFALKVVTDLERIGDEAANMAERAAQLAEHGFPVSRLQPQLQRMAGLTKELVHQALDAFVEGDEALAREVRARDDEVDALYGAIRRGCLAYVEEHPDRVPAAMCIASTSKYLERIADHATNIAEMVVFVTSGEDVRHPVPR
ncbi:MAG TPA: phosphate signaling complex protein PhoU [Sandaracinaceae bacterium LLY-WYZ-13_1]|nr:phosphate signaling complex protein PhoU [Sandaracinaceae bacterium LLY-WYZ-13_1]